MVFQDISKSFELKQTDLQDRTANLMDRFFAFLIDLSVILPFVFFLLYLTFTDGLNFWRSHPAAPENDSFALIIIFCFTVYFSLIQTIFIVLWKSTPGQYFLKIKIKTQDTNDFIYFRIFLRQFTFWWSFIFLGFPFLTMMTNKSRRTFYDRISNTFVVSQKEDGDDLIFDSEFRYWQSFMTTLTFFSSFLIVIFVWRQYHQVIQRNLSFIALDEKNYFCKELKNVEMNKRLSVAVALNLVNQLSDECLEKEADFVLWKQIESDSSLAYYAKSLTASDIDSEKAYQEQSCKGQNISKFSNLSLGCKISYSFINNKFEELYLELNEDSFLNDLLKYELSQIFDKNAEIKINFSKIKKYNEIKLVKKYQLIEILTHNEFLNRERRPAAVNNEVIQQQNRDQNEDTNKEENNEEKNRFGNDEIIRMIEDL